ncbi:hypothetical protein MM326_13765 [Alkalihalobacillus sp. LMS6]|uniref:hypothetical protein n=1 Tax=Alkalihalobacillus sp. LMS6 TaxID=2924034 RepID=UPI0020D18465|nr:hypothetical protein [Alkalihalobacillus sp. LMS6]UTR05175.1 hypothetical protein MM326_13765 [Alkalihalobacillus sp. LMS6]
MAKTEQKTHVIDGVTYVEVARKAEVGEKVIIVDRDSPQESYKDGDVLVVSFVSSTGIRSVDAINDVNFTGYISDREYHVLEPEAYDRDEVIETLIRKVDALEQRLAEAEEGERQLFRLFSRLDDICENLIDKAEDAEADIALLDERTGGLRKCR